RGELFNMSGRVEEAVARREGAGDDHPHLIAAALEDLREGEHGAEAVAVGPDMRRQQEALMAVDYLNKGGPVNRHVEPRCSHGSECHYSSTRKWRGARRPTGRAAGESGGEKRSP